MRTLRRDGELIVRAPAKVNLFLEILGKRPDGYHEIATLMVAIGLCDTLRFTDDPSGTVTLDVGRSNLSSGADNLIVKAARLLQDRSGCYRGARIRLTKRIPTMAGLAGGSSDAAATLIGLNEQWRLGLSMAELARIGSEIGSDIAFFFSLPAAWCTGRGETVRQVAMGRPLDLVLVCPPFGCGTADVYRQLRVPGRPIDGSAMLRAAELGDIEAITANLHNRLAAPAEIVAPELSRLRARLPASGTMLSGSGSTLFALRPDRTAARRLAQSVRDDPAFRGCRVFVVRTLSAAVLPVGAPPP
jgi:4-diphosphocytidyl-2-C-methyl-D-erythritol kinase